MVQLVAPRLLEKHQLTGAIFEAVRDLLTEKRLLLKTGTIVDATIIAAPSSTKNATKSRDPEMKQARKGNQWYFGMKLQIGTDRRGRVHHVRATHAAAADITQMPDLLHGEERELYGDQAYWKEDDRRAFEARGVRYRVNRRGAAGNRSLGERWRAINRARSRTRARAAANLDRGTAPRQQLLRKGRATPHPSTPFPITIPATTPARLPAQSFASGREPPRPSVNLYTLRWGEEIFETRIDLGSGSENSGTR